MRLFRCSVNLRNNRLSSLPASLAELHALRTLDVPTQLVVYPGEGHLVSRPEHRRDIMRRTAAWLDR